MIMDKLSNLRNNVIVYINSSIEDNINIDEPIIIRDYILKLIKRSDNVRSLGNITYYVSSLQCQSQSDGNASLYPQRKNIVCLHFNKKNGIAMGKMYRNNIASKLSKIRQNKVITF